MTRKALLALVLLASSPVAHAVPLLVEDFDDVTALSGWSLVNNSTPGGSTGWFQGNDGVFGSQSGVPSSYIAANFENADLGGTISNWLITPELALGTAATVSFYTRSSGFFADRLELRASFFGTDVGATEGSVGSFTNLLLSVNPLLAVPGYPNDWTQFTIDVSGFFAGLGSGHLAFRYFVPDTNVNGDYIGIDSLVVDSRVVAVPEPWTPVLFMTGLLGLLLVRRPRRG